MSEEPCKLRLKDAPKHERGKVPNPSKKYFIQGHSCTVFPYILYLLIQSGKVSPNHEGETSDGNISADEIVLDMLVYVGISCKYARGGEKYTAQSKASTFEKHHQQLVARTSSADMVGSKDAATAWKTSGGPRLI